MKKKKNKKTNLPDVFELVKVVSKSREGGGASEHLSEDTANPPHVEGQ